MNTQYLVVKKAVCPRCEGRKDIWVPGGEVDCPDCGGTGWQRVEVPLEEALRELGVMLPRTGQGGGDR